MPPFSSYALLKHLQMVYGDKILIICPKSLIDTWKSFCRDYEIMAEFLTMGMLSHGTVDLNSDPEYQNIDTVLIDESHNFRYPNTNRYQELQPFLYDKKTILLTATPRNNSHDDIYYQIKLFHQEEETAIPIEPSNLRKFFNEVEIGNKQIQELLRHILIRRTRYHILKYYGEEDKNGRTFIRIDGDPFYFPERRLKTHTYSIDDTYSGFYDIIMDGIKSLSYAKYGLWNYLRDNYKNRSPYNDLERIGNNLRGLMKVLLLKRLESSICAFKETVGRFLSVHQLFFKSLDKGFIPAGEEASDLLYDAESYDEELILENLEQLSEKYNDEAFHLSELKSAIEHDIDILKKIQAHVEQVDAASDDKLIKLKEILNKDDYKKEKVLIFTQYADTAKYLYDNLKNDDVSKITSEEKNRLSIIRRFAPDSNNYKLKEADEAIRVLISTDVLSEGLNLQDAFLLINYDLHWNPVRLIQRIGRLDRIGAKSDVVYINNFLPERKLEKHLELKKRIQNRIGEIHRTIGEDDKILDKTEKINTKSMYAIYEENNYTLDDFAKEEDPLSEDLFGLSEAEGLLRELQDSNPEYLAHIKNLPDGVRSAKQGGEIRNFVFCQAGDFQNLFLTDEQGNLKSSDVLESINLIKCEKNEPTKKIPSNFNKVVTKTLKRFRRTVRERITKQDEMKSLKVQQRYVLNTLQDFYENTDDESLKLEIEELKKVLSMSLPNIVLLFLNKLKNSKVEGKPLVDRLKEIYFQYGLQRMKDRTKREFNIREVPKIVCSMAIVKEEED